MEMIKIPANAAIKISNIYCVFLTTAAIPAKNTEH